MPTTRPRHSVTETEEVTRALSDAARRWPQDSGSPARLLVRLLHEGHRAIEGAVRGAVAERRSGIESAAGSLTGVYPEGYLADLRDDWPA